MSRRTLAFALTALLLGSAQALTVKLASMSPLTGGQSDQGVQIRNATQLAVADYAPQFKKLGVDLQLVSYDDQADPAVGTANARRMVADPLILAMIGTYNSGVAIPVSEVFAPSHLALITPSATGVKVTTRGLNNVNRVVARDDAQGAAIGKFIAGSLKAKRAYMLNDKTAYGQGLSDEVEKYLRANGVQIVASEGTEEKIDFGSIVTKIGTAKPDIVFFGGIFDQGAKFVKQLREAGVNSAVMGGDGWDSSQFQVLAGRTSAGVLYTATAAPAGALPSAAKLAARYRQAYKAEVQGFGITAYDAAQVALRSILGLLKPGGPAPTRAQVEAAIRGATVRGLITGDVQFNDAGDRKNARIYVIRIQPDLSTKVVEAVGLEGK